MPSCTLILRAVLIGAIFVGAPGRAGAQAVESLGTGTRIRITAPAVGESMLIGYMSSLSGDSLVLLREQRPRRKVVVPRSAIESVEIYGGRPRYTAAGVAAGVVVGALLGAVLGGANCDPMVCGAVTTYSAIGGGLLGALVGAGVGGSIPAGPERWIRVLPEERQPVGRVP